MSWHFVWDPYPDPRIANDIPPLTDVQKRQLVKSALQHIPGGDRVFNRAFGGTYKQDPVGLVHTPDTGMPWIFGTQARG